MTTVEFFHNVQTGLYIIGRSMETVELWPAIIMGKYDIEIKCSLYRLHATNGNNDIPSESELNDPAVLESLAKLKFLLKDFSKKIFTEADSQEAALKMQDFEDICKKWKTSLHLPSQYGTTDEIASQFRISKKKVRQMKRDGTLDDYIASHSKRDAG